MSIPYLIISSSSSRKEATITIYLQKKYLKKQKEGVLTSIIILRPFKLVIITTSCNFLRSILLKANPPSNKPTLIPTKTDIDLPFSTILDPLHSMIAITFFHLKSNLLFSNPQQQAKRKVCKHCQLTIFSYPAEQCQPGLNLLETVYNKLIAKGVMGSTQFALPCDMANQWSEITSNGKLIIRNTISQQHFTIHHITKNTSNGTKEYLRRSIYSLPHTPRIIVLEETQDSLFIMAQQSMTHLKFLLRKKNLLIQVLAVIKELIGVAQQLKQKYGAFEIRQDLIGVLRNQQIFMWINSKFQLNQIQTPLQHTQNQQQAMISAIIKICQKHCKFNLSFLNAQPAATTTFSHFIHQLAIKMEIQKLKLTQKHIMVPQTIHQEKEAMRRNNSSKNVNSNLKNFDRKCNIQSNGFQIYHRKQLGLSEQPQNKALGSPLKKKPNRRGRVTSQQLFSPIYQQTSEQSLNSINQQRLQFSQASIPIINLKQMKIFKDSKVSGSRPSPTPTNEEMTFCQAKIQKENNWDLKKRITCSTQQNINNFSDSYRRQSTIRWVQEPTAGEKSLIEDYHCLFAKNTMNLSRKTNQEEAYKFQI